MGDPYLTQASKDHARRVNALASIRAKDELIAAAAAEIEKLRRERDEADRRAGAAERRLEHEVENRSKRSWWLDDAKRERGYSTNESFDVVWADVKAKADRATAAEAKVAEMREAFRNADDLDWKWLYERIANAGHGHFWIAVFDEFRRALSDGGAHG